MPAFLKDKWPFFAFGGVLLLLVVAVFISKMEKPFGVAGNMLIQLTAITTPTSDDLLYVVDDPGGTPADRKLTYANLKSTIESGLTVAESQTLAQVTALGATATATVSLTGGLLVSSSTVTGALTVVGATTLATTTVMGKGVCLSDGTYCPSAGSESDTLQTVTARGATTNQALSLYGGFVAASSSVTSTFNVWGTMNALAIVSPTATIMGKGVCLSDGTYCAATAGGGGSDINWTWSEAGGFVRQTTSSNDLILGSTATTTGAPIYLDTSGATIGTSTLTIGHSTNVNVVIGGTSSTQLGMSSSLFVMNGNDLWVKGNIGSPTTVISNIGFRAVDSHYGRSVITAEIGLFSIKAPGGVILEDSDTGRNWYMQAGNLFPTFNSGNQYPGAVGQPRNAIGSIYSSGSVLLLGHIEPTTPGVLRIGSVTSSIDAVYASGTSQLKYVSSTAVSVNGLAVCLSDGTNCPAGSGIPTLAQVTAMGASATATLQLYGGFLAASSTVTSSFYVVGATTLTNATATTLFTTSLKGTSSTITTIAATDLFSAGATSTALFATSFKATSSTIATLAAGTFFYGNATGTNLFGTVVSSTNLFSSAASLGGLVVSSTTVCLSNGVGCLAASASAAGIVELATIGETSAGSDATRAVTPDGLAGSVFGSKTVELYLTTSTGALLAVNSASNTSTCFTVQPPLAGMVLTAAHVAHGVAGSGTTSTVVNIKTTSSLFLLSTPLYIDPGEYGSETAVTSSVINTSNADVFAYQRLCADVQNVENTTPGKETILSLTFSLP